jgi:hypothetical protein
MKAKCFKGWLISVTLLIVLFAFAANIFAKEATQKWELINPEGVIKIELMEINPHPSTLEGKTVILRWNGKHNGDNFLNKVAEMLRQRVKGIKIVKSWEVAPETVDPISGSQERSMELMKKLAAFKPDLVIGSQAD